MTDNDQVIIAVLKQELEHQRQFFALKFQSLGERLDEHCDRSDTRALDLELRLRAIENRTTWSRIIEGLLGLIAAVAVALGFKQS